MITSKQQLLSVVYESGQINTLKSDQETKIYSKSVIQSQKV
jgi:hypothetical protein